jgi:hypothetical protein
MIQSSIGKKIWRFLLLCLLSIADNLAYSETRWGLKILHSITRRLETTCHLGCRKTFQRYATHIYKSPCRQKERRRVRLYSPQAPRVGFREGCCLTRRAAEQVYLADLQEDCGASPRPGASRNETEENTWMPHGCRVDC